jgi:hypothetical protein
MTCVLGRFVRLAQVSSLRGFCPGIIRPRPMSTRPGVPVGGLVKEVPLQKPRLGPVR